MASGCESEQSPVAHREQREKEHSVQKKKKKDKHLKKAKKAKKKNKKQKSEKKDDLLDSSSDSSVEWVESDVSQSCNAEKAWKVNKQSDAVSEPSLQREEWMNLDFMLLKTTSSAAVRGERHKEKILERQKTQELEQNNVENKCIQHVSGEGELNIDRRQIRNLVLECLIVIHCLFFSGLTCLVPEKSLDRITISKPVRGRKAELR
ncbi:hypothetical protein AAES_81972 [Amazona aestiva]|uniref:CWF19-like protein 2 n=1 Tax=Amazona aestiva TaxID=12930 RepID=A0A0Q3PZB7_AMAAE|nr:hypothetical protein AAES_81972 [Amazona aestiva]